MDEFRGSKPQPESTTESATRYTAKLKMNAAPKIVHLPSVSRNVDEVAPKLREHIRQVVNGLMPWPLFIHGSVGCGKTCSALCVLDRCHRQDHKTTDDKGREWWVTDQPSGVYRTSHEVCEALQGEFGRKSKPVTDRTWDEWSKTRLAVLDELGSREKVGDFVYNTTKALIDLRSGKPLIVISNLDLPTLAVLYDDRLTSRLAAGTVVRIEGQDRRLMPR